MCMYIYHVWVHVAISVPLLPDFTGVVTCKMCASRHKLQAKYLEQVRVSCVCVRD